LRRHRIGARRLQAAADDKKEGGVAGVAVLVFAQHVVLAGAVKTEESEKRVEELVKRERAHPFAEERAGGGRRGQPGRATLRWKAEINAGPDGGERCPFGSKHALRAAISSALV